MPFTAGIAKSKKDIKVTLLYPPIQTAPDAMCKPNGSLAYPMLGGALIEYGTEVEVFDASTGNDKDDLDEVFYKSTQLPSGLLRTGVSDERILEEVSSSDIVGLTSIFSAQETMVLNTIKIIKKKYPEKLVIAGGVNARNRLNEFFASGIDLVSTSEAEKTIVDIVKVMEKQSRDFSDVPGIAYQKNGKTVISPPPEIIWDLDQLPMPAWHLLPNERYWKIARPHGGVFEPGTEIKYASMMTSLGCPFTCSYCHIADEKKDSISGEIGRFRIKSDERVLKELKVLKSLGVKQLYIEDDSFFGKKHRAMRLLRKIKGSGFHILDTNGLNLVHLLKDNKPDREAIEALVEAGFKVIALGYESANPRIIKKYASNKWDVEKTDVVGVIRMCKEYGLTVSSNYMIGYPDETREEINLTIEAAKLHIKEGLDIASVVLVMPLPGSPLFDMVIREGYLPPDYSLDDMYWGKANMINTHVPPKDLEQIRAEAWEEVNNPEYVNYKKEMRVS